MRGNLQPWDALTGFPPYHSEFLIKEMSNLMIQLKGLGKDSGG